MMTSTTKTYSATLGPWTLHYSGGRTGDVYHLESDRAQDCVSVGNYDWTKGRVRHAGQRSVDAALRDWVREYGSCYSANLA